MTITSISDDIKKEVKRCLTKAINAVGEYGIDSIELNIDYSNDDDYKGAVMYHSSNNSFGICDLDIDLNNEEIKDYVIKAFKDCNIDVCEN